MTIKTIASVGLALIWFAITNITVAEARTRYTQEIQAGFDRHDVRGYVVGALAPQLDAGFKQIRRKHQRRHRDDITPPSRIYASLDPSSASIEPPQRVERAGLIKIGTDDNGGGIVVDRSVADRFEGFIADVRARGFKGRIHCHATRGHVHNSNHYWGGACDFAQRGWNKTVAVMYHVRDLASKHGLRDGCSFGDCGHIDVPRSRYARR